MIGILSRIVYSLQINGEQKMPKFIITWDAGYGETSQEIDASDLESAEMEAYAMWKEEAENNAEYSAQEYTEQLAEDLGV
jgi:hypothetical protein